MKEIIIDKCQTPSDGQKFEDEINLILCSNDKVDIGIELEKLGDKTTLKRFPEHHPILFCPFPLIGANDFPFPIIINSESFIPKEERDGIWLEDTIEGRVNHEVFEQAVELFKLLTKEISRSGWKTLSYYSGLSKILHKCLTWTKNGMMKKFRHPLKSLSQRYP